MVFTSLNSVVMLLFSDYLDATITGFVILK